MFGESKHCERSDRIFKRYGYGTEAADELAGYEILDEIHAMLRELLKRTADQPDAGEK